MGRSHVLVGFAVAAWASLGCASVAAGGRASKGAAATGTGGASDRYRKPATPPADEDGSQLWLRYLKVLLLSRLAEYQAGITQIVKAGSSATLQAAERELTRGLAGLLGTTIPVRSGLHRAGAVVLGTPASSAFVRGLALGSALTAVGNEGYLVEATTIGGDRAIVIAGNTDLGVLHGTFAFLRWLQRHQPLDGLSLAESPKVQRRILDHWDNLDGTVERGYAGRSLWRWSELPETLSPRIIDYARANASIGINGVVLNNGNADPLDGRVARWWVAEADLIYARIPDFGGFLVKAGSEGQPGPGDYGRTHAQGANMLAAALAPHGGVVLWRAFVYRDDGTDRVGQAYREFRPLDGQFGAGTMVQVKNGPLDFQPREPFHPLFGAMPHTPLALEVQITKEYLGADTHLAYLGTMWQEVLRSDTYARGPGWPVARVIEAMAGVSGIGS